MAEIVACVTEVDYQVTTKCGLLEIRADTREEGFRRRAAVGDFPSRTPWRGIS